MRTSNELFLLAEITLEYMYKIILFVILYSMSSYPMLLISDKLPLRTLQSDLRFYKIYAIIRTTGYF